eukprot:TRINITY_DN2947_c0_g1_i1.p1 TRINITY_DN2947_c0_g1~~TRINITY_DN2947_c0_g1_i1.p1  ORF type:complete len:261 (+),score=20.61 TRINITY_DN2947_c0_g1_i1:309-1091(+)
MLVYVDISGRYEAVATHTLAVEKHENGAAYTTVMELGGANSAFARGQLRFTHTVTLSEVTLLEDKIARQEELIRIHSETLSNNEQALIAIQKPFEMVRNAIAADRSFVEGRPTTEEHIREASMRERDEDLRSLHVLEVMAPFYRFLDILSIFMLLTSLASHNFRPNLIEVVLFFLYFFERMQYVPFSPPRVVAFLAFALLGMIQDVAWLVLCQLKRHCYTEFLYKLPHIYSLICFGVLIALFVGKAAFIILYYIPMRKIR